MTASPQKPFWIASVKIIASSASSRLKVRRAACFFRHLGSLGVRHMKATRDEWVWVCFHNYNSTR